MRVLLVSEGKHEQGSDDHLGALPTLVRRLSSASCEIEQDIVSRKDIHAFHGKGDGYFKRVVRWLLEARDREFDAIVLVIDEDGDRERVAQINSAQVYEQKGSFVRRAFGVAIRSFDAWMLADEVALSTSLSTPIPRQPEPESITDPKGECERLQKESRTLMGLAEMYTAISEAADLDRIADRCPKGFRPFAGRVRSLGT